MVKEHLTLNNQQWLICHKTQPNQTNQSKFSLGKLIPSFLLDVADSLQIIMDERQNERKEREQSDKDRERSQICGKVLLYPSNNNCLEHCGSGK